MVSHIVVLMRASAPVDADLVTSYCRALSVELGVPLELRVVRDAREAEAAVTNADAAAGVIVLCDSLAEQRDLLAAAVAADNPRLVWVDLDSAIRARDAALLGSRIWNIRGRGLEGIRWAARTVVARSEAAWVTEPYGALPDQVGDLRVPAAGGGRFPVVVLIHGGAWRDRWERDLMDSLAVDLTARGYATWNIEYRRYGPSGGGWPTTFEDVAAAIDSLAPLAERYPLEVERVAFAGHSAGGHLAVWAAMRGGLPDDAPGASPVVTPSAVVSLAGVLDLVEMGRRGNEEGATMLFMGGLPGEAPAAYELASPAARLPLGDCAQLITYGTADRIDLVDNNRRYCALARAAGDDVVEFPLPGADHFHVIDPRSLAWTAIADRFGQLFPAAVEAEEAVVGSA